MRDRLEKLEIAVCWGMVFAGLLLGFLVLALVSAAVLVILAQLRAARTGTRLSDCLLAPLYALRDRIRALWR